MTVLEPVVQFLRGFKGKTITLEKVIAGAERPRKPVLRVMDRLVREGYLEEIEDNPLMRGYGVGGHDMRNPTWRIISKPLAEIAARRPKRRTALDRIWLLIRARRRVTNAEIKSLANVSLTSAEKYTNLLEQHEYLRMCGTDGHRKVYLLVKDPGPIRPILKEIVKEKIDD